MEIAIVCLLLAVYLVIAVVTRNEVKRQSKVEVRKRVKLYLEVAEVRLKHATECHASIFWKDRYDKMLTTHLEDRWSDKFMDMAELELQMQLGDVREMVLLDFMLRCEREGLPQYAIDEITDRFPND